MKTPYPLFFLSVLTLFLTACATTDYVGQTYPPTTHADVYMDGSQVTREYTVMGQAKTEATEYMTFQDMQKQLVVDAMAKGADGIIITGMETIQVGSSSYTSGQSKGDSPEYYLTEEGKLETRNKGGDHSYTAATSTTQIRDHVLSAQLIKYTN